MKIAIDDFALAILFSFLVLLWLLKAFFFPSSHYRQSPSFKFSTLSYFTYSSWKESMIHLPRQLHLFSLVCLLIAFVNPHLLIPVKNTPLNNANEPSKEGIALYLVLDDSGSMAEPVHIDREKGTSNSISKINYLKEVTHDFVNQRTNDLIGVVSFARVPKVEVPLTLDKEAINQAIDRIEVVTNSQDDGTAMGYAIYKTASLLAATRSIANDPTYKTTSPYTIKGSAIIVVTDGFQDPSRLDLGNKWRTLELDDASQFVKKEGIRLYVIGIDPALSASTFAPQRRLLQKITEDTGGRYFLVNDTANLQDIYAQVNQLEKGEIRHTSEDKNREMRTLFSAAPFLLSLATLACFLSLFIESTLLRRVP